jgi:hypothetical protein
MSETPADERPQAALGAPAGDGVTAEPQPAKTSGTPKIVAAIIAGGVLVIGVILFFALRSGSETLTVDFALLDQGSSCAGGVGGYSDVGPGMDVVVRNNDAKVIATGELGGGDSAGTTNVGCVWTAVLDDVPGGEDYYEISVGNRGEQVYSHEDLESKGWKVDLSLGGDL